MSVWQSLDQSARLALLQENARRGRFPVTYSIFDDAEPIFSTDPKFRPLDIDRLPPTAILVEPANTGKRIDLGRRIVRRPKRPSGAPQQNILPGLLGKLDVQLDLPRPLLWLLLAGGALVLILALRRR